MKENNQAKKFVVVLGIIIPLVTLSIICILYHYNTVDWTGAYKDTFRTVDETDPNFYIKFSPLVEIKDIGDSYRITISLSTFRVPASMNTLGGQAGGTHYIPIEIPKKQAGRHLYIEAKYEETDEQIGLFCELEYIDEKNIRFRYAKTYNELQKQEYYTLVKLKYSTY